MAEINCSHCEILIPNARRNQKFCSNKCSCAKRVQDGWVTHTCVRCGTEFKRMRNRKAQYCTKSCLLGAIHEKKQATRKQVVTKKCAACEKEFQTKDNHKYCSVNCAATTSAARMGHANKKQTKVCPCAACGVDVTVARNVPEKKVHCEEHRAFYKTPKERECLRCQKKFMAIRPTSRWCSVKCASTVSAQERAVETKEAHCRECGTTVIVPRASDHNRVLCPEHRRAAKRAGNARVAAANQEKKRADFAARLMALLDRFGSEASAVSEFILEQTRYSRPLQKVADLTLKKHAEKIEVTKRTQETVKQIKYLSENIAGSRAKRPYDHFLITGLVLDEAQDTWVLSMKHEAKDGPTRTVLLGKYLIEAKMGRLLRDEEELTWVSGIKRDCSLENLRVVTKVTPIEYRGFWSAREQKEAS
jgi:hypothetical protein